MSTWFEIKYNPSVLGLRTKVLNPTDAKFSDDLQSFLTYRGELGIRYGFIPGPVFLSDSWSILDPSRYRIVTLSPGDSRGIENINEVYLQYETWDFVELTIYPSDIKSSKLFPEDDEELGKGVWYSEALVPAYDDEDITEERVRKDLLTGFLRVWTPGSFKIYIPKVPKTWLIYLRARRKNQAFSNYVGSIGISEVDLSEGTWNILGNVITSYKFRTERPVKDTSPFYWDPGIIRIALVRFTYVSLDFGYDDLGLGAIGIDKETWRRFRLFGETYGQGTSPILVVSLSGWLRDEISEDLEIAMNILDSISRLEYLETKF